MVAVAQQHGVQIPLPPFIEEQVVIKGALALPPAIEGLVDHIQAQGVARFQQRRGRRVVRGADGVEARFLELKNAPALRVGPGARAQRAVVVVYAAAAQLYARTVHQQPLLRIGGYGADAKAHAFRVDRAVFRLHARLKAPQEGRFRRP